MNRQPHMANSLVRLEPLQAEDFEALYAVACDPLIWEQHPNNDRYQRDRFAAYFDSAIESGGALRVLDKGGALIGCSRYYDLDEATRAVAIGYTFLARSAWGQGYNRAMKSLMLDNAFESVDRVLFHVGAANTRSRRAMDKLGGVLIGEVTMTYRGETTASANVVYAIDREAWARSNS